MQVFNDNISFRGHRYQKGSSFEEANKRWKFSKEDMEILKPFISEEKAPAKEDKPAEKKAEPKPKKPATKKSKGK